MTNVPEKLWHVLNLFEDFVRYGEKTEHPPAPQPRVGTVSEDHPVGVRARSIDDREQRLQRLAAVAERVRRCTRCPLAEGRMNAVPGVGVLDPQVMVIGEGPGADEDRRGIPFVGRAGEYLDKWLDAIEVSRDKSAFIGNIVKCRPPGNRDPTPFESDACMPYLREQIELIRPKTILSVGRIASGLLIGSTAGIGRLRGKTYYYDGIPLIPTYHPSGVLRNPDFRRPVWQDLKRLAELLQPAEETAGDNPEQPSA